MSQPVFRDYDQAALDAEYDNRAKVADSADFINHWDTASQRARVDLPVHPDRPFGPAPAEVLDVFPAEQPWAPVNVFYHGGYWRALHKNDFSFVAFGLRPAGVATVVVNYALVPAVTLDEQICQCRAALAWVWHNAESFGGDRERIYLSGHSAGGHLVAMMMATDWPGFDPALPAEPVRGGCGISGLYDLEPIRRSFLNADLGLDEVVVERASPVRLPRRCRGPLLLPFGAAEGPEFRRQSEDLAAAWGDDGSSPQPLAQAGQNHFSIVTQLERPDSALTRLIHHQMGVA